MSVNVLYRTSAKATGGRDGQAATLDGTLNVNSPRRRNSEEAAARATIPNSFSRPDTPPVSSAR
jgi:hypothetical protein